MNVLERIHTLKKILKEVGKVALWQGEIYTKITTHEGDASAHHTKTTAGELNLADMAEKAHGSLTGVTVDQHHARGHDHSLAPDGSPIAVAGVPNLPASKVTSGRFPVGRLPAMTSGKIWKGTGGNVEEVDFPVGVPSGVIAMWHGLIANIPSGWVICDGNSGTPNLLAKFVEGVATAATNPGATGGEATHTLTVAEMPAHTHSHGRYSSLRNQCGETYGATNTCYGSSTKTTGSKGGSGAHENRPPFFDLAFIMKT